MRDTLKPDEHFTTSARSWQPFDDFVTAAHNAGIKVIVDFAPNHSNVRGSGDDGRLEANGVLQATYTSNPGGFFQTGPNMGGAQWDSPYETQYYTIYDLADLNQTQVTVDALLKASVTNLQNHGVDAFEWVADDSNNPLYKDLLKFSNKSGVPELNFPLFTTINSVFGQGGAFSNLSNVVTAQQADFAYQNDLVNFVDNHDRKRFLTVDTSANDQKHLYEALAFVLTARGIPTIYYGTEQYLEGGDDPDNRRKMPAFSETTTAFKLIKSLSTLRKDNEALGYGGVTQRWLSADVYIYERKFYDSVVVVAINKGTAATSITNLVTSLPPATYTDYMTNLVGGVSITATTVNGAGWNVTNFSLPANSVSVWQRDPSVSTPQLGNVSPTAAQPGVKVVISGQGFGSVTGSVKFGATAAAITSWSDQQVVATVPAVGQGVHAITVTRSGSATPSNGFNFSAYQAKLIPVTFSVNNASPTNSGDNIYLTGNTIELSNWASTAAGAVGAMLTTPTTYPNWWLTVSPARRESDPVQGDQDPGITWENGANHSYTVPASGVGTVNVNWQY